MINAEVFIECLSHEYKCHEGQCIHKDWLCDGTFDCRHGDDEAPSCSKITYFDITSIVRE